MVYINEDVVCMQIVVVESESLRLVGGKDLRQQLD
jgi:hypothetical protein